MSVGNAVPLVDVAAAAAAPRRSVAKRCNLFAGMRLLLGGGFELHVPNLPLEASRRASSCGGIGLLEERS